MSISVREIITLKEFKAFKLIAGESGLDNQVSSIGILDYEYALQDGDKPRKWTFRKRDFVISSLLFAKGHPELLISAVRDLCNDQIAALAVKNVCYEKLPAEVIAYADKHGLPIFMFGRDDAYFEDIVVTLKEKIRERDNLELQEHQIYMLLNQELDLKAQRELNQKLLPDRVTPYRVIYCYIKDTEQKIRDYRKYYPGNRISGKKQDSFYYKKGCFMIYYTNSSADIRSSKEMQQCMSFIKERLLMKAEDYWIGIGEIKDNTEALTDAMMESICAQQYGQLYDKDKTVFHELGIYQILLPCFRQKWFLNYSNKIINAILDFDRQNNGDLYKTMEAYVKNYGNIQTVADHFFMHKNSIRYRINKVRELTGMEDDSSFDTQIFLAFMIDELKQWFEEI